MRKFIDFVFSLPDWLRAGRADFEAAHQRRLTPEYRAKKRKLRTVWIVAGIAMLLYPELPFIAIVALVTTFLSFGILDSD